MPDPSAIFESNFLGTKNLFEVLRSLGLQKTRVVIPGTAAEYGNIKEVGKALFQDYLVPFELTSILLLVGIVGAVVLSKKEAS